MFRLLVALCVLVPIAGWASPNRVAVLPIEGASVSLSERLTLTDQVRRTGLTFLVPSARYRILTRENLETMLPPGKSMADCVGECALQTAQLMNVDYVVTGQIVQVEGEYRLNIGLYATTTATPLASITAGGVTVGAVEVDLSQRLRAVFLAIVDHVGGSKSKRRSVGEIITVQFRSDPEGATVTVDGRTLCVTPCKEDLEVGRYRVSMAKVGYVSREVNEQILGARTVALQLDKDEGGMHIRSIPRKMDIFINGKHAGETPQRFSRSPKLYRVRVGREECALPHIQNVSVARGRVIDVDFKPSVHPAGLKVELVDESKNHVRATIYSDGEPLGETFEHIGLPLCTTRITLRAGGHKQEVELKLSREKITTMRVRWDGPPVFSGRP